MKKRVSFQEICQLSTLAFSEQIEHHSYFKQTENHDVEWDRVFPEVEVYLHNKLFLQSLEGQTASTLPWNTWKSESTQAAEKVSTPNWNEYSHASLFLSSLGANLVDRCSKKLLEIFSVKLPIIIDPNRVPSALAFDLWFQRFSNSCFAELTNRMQKNPKLKAGFGITLGSGYDPKIILDSDTILREWAERRKLDDGWEANYHDWLHKHLEKPLHQQIQDASTLGQHVYWEGVHRRGSNTQPWAPKALTLYIETVIQDHPLIEEPPPELTPEKREKIVSLFDQIKGASGSTGLRIVETLCRTGDGLSNKALARETNLSVKTVSRYRGTKKATGYLEVVGSELTIILLE